jgi:hypothetical protein
MRLRLMDLSAEHSAGSGPLRATKLEPANSLTRRYKLALGRMLEGESEIASAEDDVLCRRMERTGRHLLSAIKPDTV